METTSLRRVPAADHTEYQGSDAAVAGNNIPALTVATDPPTFFLVSVGCFSICHCVVWLRFCVLRGVRSVYKNLGGFVGGAAVDLVFLWVGLFG